MSNLIRLEGTYKIIGNHFIHTTQNLKLLLTSRINVTDKKPVKFLLDKTDNKGSYISSLYPLNCTTETETYKFDYKGIKYILRQSKADCIAEIKPTKITE
jgi:hypothetical protein